MEKNNRILVLGGSGLVGSALQRFLESKGYFVFAPPHSSLDLLDLRAVDECFRLFRPEYLFLAAAKVGGIGANSRYPADFIRSNIGIQFNVIDSAHRHKVKKLLFLGSSCIHPRDCPQPILEEYLLTGPFEKTNDAYAVAKIAGIKACQAYNAQHGTRFISCLPTNLYRPGDNYNPEDSHVLPALIGKFYMAKLQGDKSVTLWGTGKPLREFLYVDDLAEACTILMRSYESSVPINIGSSEEVSIRELAEVIAGEVGFEGEIVFDPQKPDGTPRKLLDSTRMLSMGWKPRVSLKEGVKLTLRDFAERAGIPALAAA